ncbi:tripartite tricarboxylate transporter TctB family protein [uncultured Bosea sp.]|uniref:tripartite tricarboxylate transporter TctB family protein n=1 Tax=uncultured Bosea sp. TaxID=211457 RepID=UPI00263B60D0|nr:tripartite tricarboxylate transporter TctB family protein [uncultured Bosea sp.]
MSLNQIEQAQGLRVRSTQDLAGGLFMILLAVGAFVFSWDLPAGTLRQLGPGMLPKAFAVICGALGLMLALASLRYHGEQLSGWSWKGIFFALGGALLFGLTIRGFEVNGFLARVIAAGLMGAAATIILSYLSPLNNPLSLKLGHRNAATSIFALLFLIALILYPVTTISVPALGLLVSGPLLIFFSGLAADDRKPKELLIFAVAMSLGCILLFKYALSLPIPLAPWLLGI